MDENIAFTILQFTSTPEAHARVSKAFNEASKVVTRSYCERNIYLSTHIEEQYYPNYLALTDQWGLLRHQLFSKTVVVEDNINHIIEICLSFGRRKLACEIADRYGIPSNPMHHMLLSWLMNTSDKQKLLKELFLSDMEDYCFVGFLTRGMVSWLLEQEWVLDRFRRMDLLAWQQVHWAGEMIPVDIYSYHPFSSYIKDSNTPVVTHAQMPSLLHRTKHLHESQNIDMAIITCIAYNCAYGRYPVFSMNRYQSVMENLTSMSLNNAY